ncbi:MAG: metal-dependent phosphohydrolase [Armatimonadetes bacterium JP3_11]|jgi:putative nucleotidyltransferase with HDIG domain|nr:MAG: metal-dependent phosphohydrolase [Armatimonadetes bacterium CP1_7O]OYT74473.1 MAG: metal-dependent phosphohydrolase [Armatimonadetes bacterium JP3_11]RMH10733.1 MAG: HD domain-containing protein [Armatimonadota bacterium]
MQSPLTFAEILSALSHALDITEGQPRGHAVRTAYIALRIGQELKLTDLELRDLYKASLLKDAGCSSNAVRVYKVFAADDLLTKRDVKLVNWSNPLESMRFALEHIMPGANIFQKIVHALRETRGSVRVMDEVTLARCTRGAMIARYIGFTEQVAQAIEYLDEHWDGRGSPYKLRGEQIPLLARILCLCQTMEVFATTFGVDAAYEMLHQRNRRWFDPELVCAACSFQNDRTFWALHAEMLHNPDMQPPMPDLTRQVLPSDIDRVCEAFAMIVDAKSSFTAEHSRRVARYAVQIAEALGWDAEQVNFIYRAGLLHDIGKLGVSNAILEKPGKLTDAEFEAIRAHPRYTYEILRRVRSFAWLAEVAGAHHERLDGRGYWQGRTAEQLTTEMRILAVADVFDALSAERPYRPALPLKQVFEIMERDSGAALDGALVATLKSLVQPADDLLPEAA